MTVNSSNQARSHVVVDLAPRRRQQEQNNQKNPKNLIKQEHALEELRSTLRTRLRKQPCTQKMDLFEELESPTVPCYRTCIPLVHTDIVAVIGVSENPNPAAVSGGFGVSFADDRYEPLVCSFPTKPEIYEHHTIYGDCLALSAVLTHFEPSRSITFVMSNPKLITYLNEEGSLEPAQLEVIRPLMASLRATAESRKGFIQAAECVTERAKLLQGYASILAEDARFIRNFYSSIKELKVSSVSTQKGASQVTTTATTGNSTTATATPSAAKIPRMKKSGFAPQQQLGSRHRQLTNTPVRFQQRNAALPSSSSSPALHLNTGLWFTTDPTTEKAEEIEEVGIGPSDNSFAKPGRHRVARVGRQIYDPRRDAIDRVKASAPSFSFSSSAGGMDREIVNKHIDSITTRFDERKAAGTKRKMGDGGDAVSMSSSSNKKKQKRSEPDVVVPQAINGSSNSNDINESFVALSFRAMQEWFTSFYEKFTT